MSLKIKLIASAVSLTFISFANAAPLFNQTSIGDKTQLDVSSFDAATNIKVFQPDSSSKLITFNLGTNISGTVSNPTPVAGVDVFLASEGTTISGEKLGDINIKAEGKMVSGAQSIVVFHAFGGNINLDLNSLNIDATNPSYTENQDSINGINVQNSDKSQGYLKIHTAKDLTIRTTGGSVVVGTLVGKNQPTEEGQYNANLELSADGAITIENTGYTSETDGKQTFKAGSAVSVYDTKWLSGDNPVYQPGSSNLSITSKTAVNIKGSGTGVSISRGNTSEVFTEGTIAAPSVAITGGNSAIGAKSVEKTSLNIEGDNISLSNTDKESKSAAVNILGGSGVSFAGINGGKNNVVITAANNKAISSDIAEFTNGSTTTNSGNVSFDNSNATIYGDVKTKGDLSLVKDTRIELKNDSAFDASSIKTDSTATLVTNYRKADGEGVKIGSVASTSNDPAAKPSLSVKTGGDLADKIGAEAAAKLLADDKYISFTGTDTEAAAAAAAVTKAGGESGHAAPSYALVKNEDGTYTTVLGTNEQMDAIKSFSAMTLTQWRNEISTLTERLGDVRDNRQAAGAWARVYGASTKVTDGATTKTTTNSIQVGADYSINPNWLVGGAFSYTNADGSFSVGSGDADGYTLSAYATGFFDCGGYVDLVGRIGRLSSDVKVAYSDGAVFDGSYDNTAYGLSAEVGWKYNVTKSVFVEPQAQLSYSYISGDNYQGADVRIEQDNFQSLVGRLGARAGFNFPKDAGQFYLTASVNHDFKGDADSKASVSGSSVAFDENVDLGGTWVSYGFGLQFAPSKNISVYGSLTRANGNDYQDNYRYSLGARYIF